LVEKKEGRMKDEESEIKRRMLEKFIKEQNYPSNPMRVAEANFNQVLSDYPIVVVDCYADWCAPCRMIAPIIAELAKEFQGKIVFGRLDVDENRAIALKFGIQSIPTLLIFNEKKLVDKIIGVLPKYRLSAYLQRFVQ
jgi:thioredoxin 1